MELKNGNEILVGQTIFKGQNRVHLAHRNVILNSNFATLKLFFFH